MFKKVGISLLATLMLSSVALACDSSLACVGKNNQESKNESKQEERKLIKFDKEIVKKMLIEDGYSNDAADRTIDKYSSQLDVSLQYVLDAYISDRTISDDFKVEGVTIKMIMEKKRYSFWAALFLMNIYIEEPEMARDLFERPPSRWDY